jgi:hypothetical protein
MMGRRALKHSLSAEEQADVTENRI